VLADFNSVLLLGNIFWGSLVCYKGTEGLLRCAG
jgi:hypothetical protein